MSDVPEKCPSCGTAPKPGDFICPRCELILDPSAVEQDPEPPREPTVIRMLLAPPEARLQRPSGPPPVPAELRETSLKKKRSNHEVTSPTVAFTLPPDPAGIPVVVAGLDPRIHDLTTFDAYVISTIDGSSSIDTLRHVAGVSLIEMQMVLHGLVGRNIVKVNDPPKRPVRKEAPPPAPARPPPRPGVPPPVVTKEANPPPPPPAGRVVYAAAAIPVARKPAPDSGAAAAFQSPLQKALVLEKEGNLKEAIAVLERAIEKAPEPGPLYNRLAIVLVKERRDYQTAEVLLRKALDLEPGNEIYEQNLFKILTLAAQLTGRHKLPTRPEKKR